ncbi:MAG: hypothetical protein N2748_02170, partial [candidate division WOR-3 bacterium]|nr:hypothetical protein [candidate division WOR-3 bacterium]
SEQLGVYIMNVLTDPRTIINLCNTPSNARGVFADKHYCYVADGRNGLVIINVSNPYQPTISTQLSLSGYANDIFIKDSLAYVACGEAGLAIVNIKDAANPVLVEYVKTSYAKSVIVPDNNYIYLADRDLGLIIIKQGD